MQESQVQGRRIDFYSPKTLHELLVLYYENPDALLFAGGTHIMTAHEVDEQIFPKKIISLENVEELSKIKRTEKYIEMGAMVTFSKIIGIGRHVVPEVLYDALSLASTPSIRNLATIGGNLCVASPYSTLFPVLYILDASIEIKNLSGSRWIPMSRFISRIGKSILKSGNLISKIRIPIGDWDCIAFEKVGVKVTQRYPSLIFTGLAKILKGVLSDIRFTFGACGPLVFRSREFELSLIGNKLPFEAKEIDRFITEFEEIFSPVSDMYSTGIYRKKTASRLIRWFIDEVSHSSYQ